MAVSFMKELGFENMISDGGWIKVAMEITCDSKKKKFSAVTLLTVVFGHCIVIYFER